MSVSAEFTDMVMDMLSDMGPVSKRRMFGGVGLFLDGIMFGLMTDETLYLKADNVNRPEFDDHGLPPFTYTRQGREVALSYFEAPPDGFDDPDVMVQWARAAWAAARRNHGKDKQAV